MYAAAKPYLDKSLKLSADFGLIPELITAQALSGRLHLQTGNFEEAFACFRRALESAREVSNRITDRKDKELYQNLPRNRFLVEQITQLARSLTVQKQAGA